MACFLLKGESKKNSLNLRRSFGLFSLATNILEGWDIIHLNGGIQSSVWSTKTFLYDIREPRYKQIKIGFRFQKYQILDNLMSWILMCHIVLLIFRLLMFYRNGFELEACLPLKSDMSQPSKLIIAIEMMHTSWRYQIQRY